MSDADVKMPEPAVVCDCGGNYYTADQLRAAVLAERERMADRVMQELGDTGWAKDIAAAIREGDK